MQVNYLLDIPGENRVESVNIPDHVLDQCRTRTKAIQTIADYVQADFQEKVGWIVPDQVANDVWQRICSNEFGEIPPELQY